MPPRCARQPGVPSTSPFVICEGKERIREIERTKEREKTGGPGNDDGCGSTTPATAGLMSSGDPNSRQVTQRALELGPRFRGLGFETLGAPPPRPPPTTIGHGSSKKQTESED